MKKQIRIPVKTKVLTDGGTEREEKWFVVVKRCSVEQHDEYMKRVHSGDMTDFEVAKELVLDWGGLKTDDGEKVPFNELNLMGVMDIPEYKRSLTDSIYEAMSGGARKAIMGKMVGR
jgi:hypothetical protein